MRRWRDCEGLWPRFVRFWCRCGCRWAQEIASRNLREEIENERMSLVLTECLRTGVPVIGVEDAHGDFVVCPACPEQP